MSLYIHCSKNTYIALLSGVLMFLLAGCAGSRPYATGPIKTFDPDTLQIPEPEEKPQFQYWDRIDNTIFHQIEKPLDLNRTFRFTGRMLGVADARQADNINHLDEVPESSWYTYRHYHNVMSTAELARGPNTVRPDTSGTWTIFRGKLEGANSGFFIEDAKGNRFLIKFDGYEYPELTTAAEVISTKIFYAAGYTVPESVITYFNPNQVTIGDGVTVSVEGETRPMIYQDYLNIIEKRPKNERGQIRALASKFVDGRPVGPWNFEGTRNDDPNDRVVHEHRRELRGMRVISSWLNDTDRRDANTMSVYTDEGYIKHYVQDFGNTLGANGSNIHKPIHGQAYLIDPRYMALSAVTLGMYVRPWEQQKTKIPYPAVGYFNVETLHPRWWAPVHPIPAFENMTLRDAFWGAKIMMSFKNNEIRAIVETGEISNPNAIDYLVETLIHRRDIIGRYWFSRMNPIDKFIPKYNSGEFHLEFSDLGVTGGLWQPEEHRYKFDVWVEEEVLFRNRIMDHPGITFNLNSGVFRDAGKKILKIDIHTLREYREGAGKSVTVYIELQNGQPRLVGIDRKV